MGTPALTTRGMKEKEMKKIAELIHEVISNLGNEEAYAKVKKEVLVLAEQFPLYQARLKGL